jgi:hypothetical protein
VHLDGMEAQMPDEAASIDNPRLVSITVANLCGL